VEATFSSEIEAMQQRGQLGAYLDAIERLAVMLSITITEGQALAISLRLDAHEVTAQEATVLASLLADDPQFCRSVSQFDAPVLPADWIGKLRVLPRPGRRYSQEERDRAVALGYPAGAFLRASGAINDPSPFVYVTAQNPVEDEAR
jgi:hypothetical protein